MPKFLLPTLTTLMLLTFFCSGAFAQQSPQITPEQGVLYNGRTVPLDSYARLMLKKIHGRDHTETQTAAQWLSGLILNPRQAVNEPVFLLQDTQTRIMLALPPQQKYFSPVELAGAMAAQEEHIQNLLQKPPETFAPEEKSIIAIYEHMLAYSGLLAGRDVVFAQGDALRLQTEVLYNRVKPFSWAGGLYAAAFLLALVSVRIKSPAINIMPSVSVLAGLACHAAGMTMRIYILQRPPVGTLYESVLFVALIVAAAAFFLFIKQKKTVFLLAASGAGAALLALAPLTLQQEDSLAPLSAVLNTDFWLATHVLCITAGYGACILTALCSHFALTLQTPVLHKIIYPLSLIALFLTAIGTILGGIWADQSWGRFWGWDPKENGALLIVLWLIWLHHGRISGHLSPRAFLAGAASLNIVVALAWFGVNLLNVGLHSYGFTSGMAAGLIAFCTVEILLIGILWTKGKRGNAA